jgi:hypothetical protein
MLVVNATPASVEDPYLKIHLGTDGLDYSIIEPHSRNLSDQGIQVIESQEVIWFFFYCSEKPYNYHLFTEEQELLLIQTCSPNITSILNYIKENNFTYDYNDFYTTHPSNWGGDWYDSIIEIDENWYLTSYNFEFTPHPLVDNTAIAFIILTLIFFAFAGYFIYKFKKTKSKKMLAGLIISIILAIILLSLTILWIWSNTQIMY